MSLIDFITKNRPINDTKTIKVTRVYSDELDEYIYFVPSATKGKMICVTESINESTCGAKRISKGNLSDSILDAI